MDEDESLSETLSLKSTKSKRNLRKKHIVSFDTDQTSSVSMGEKSAEDEETKERNEELKRARIDNWKQTETYKNLPEKLKRTIENAMWKQTKTDFYYKLNEMCQKVFMYNNIYSKREAFFERSFKERQ